MFRNLAKFSIKNQIIRLKTKVTTSKSCGASPDPSECQKVQNLPTNVEISNGSRDLKVSFSIPLFSNHISRNSIYIDETSRVPEK